MNSNPNERSDQPRSSQGRYMASEDSARKQAEIVRLIGSGLSYRMIGERVGCSIGYVSDTWKAHIAEIKLDGAEEALRKEVERLEAAGDRLEALEDQLRVTLTRKHYVVTPKGTVEDEYGNLIEDDDFLLRYAARVMDIETARGRNHDRMVKLRGLAQPVQHAVEQTVTYRIVGLDGPEEEEQQ